MSNQARKQLKINTILQSVANCNREGLGCSKEKIIAQIIIHFGACRRYVIEDLKALINSGDLMEKNGSLYIPSEYQFLTKLDVADNKTVGINKYIKNDAEVTILKTEEEFNNAIRT